MDQETFQKELTALGGTNLRGEPILRVVRGDQEMKFACGRWIPKYFVPGGAIKINEKKFRKRHIFTGEVEECTQDEAKEIWDACNRLDITNHWLAETCRIVKIIPQAREGYFIEQYIPAERIKGGEWEWEKARFQKWYDEERGGEFLTDMVGPFPRQGIYENFLHTMELDGEILNTVKRAWVARDNWEQQTPQQTATEIFAEAKEREAKSEAEMTEKLKDGLSPIHFKGMSMAQEDPHKSNKKTKHGRAK